MAKKEWKNRIVGSGEESLDDIMFNPANWRTHPKSQQEALQGVLDEVGWVQNVIINRTTGHLVDGHLRCQVAAKKGEKTIPVVYVELTTDEENLILLSLDPIGAMAASDKAKLDELMQSVQSEDERVQAMMAEMAEREGLEFGSSEPPDDVAPQIDKAEELRVKWGVESGQLWQLGEHRLICGDCTDRAVVERVMGGEESRLCFTSPPYGNLRDYETGEVDYQKLYKDFVTIAFTLCDDVIVNLGVMHKDGAVYRYWEEWLDYCESINHSLYGWYVWDQGEGYPGDYHGRLARSFEFVFHFSKSHTQANKWIPTLYTPEDAIRERSHHRNNPRTGSRQKDGSIAKFSADKVGQAFKIPDSVIRINREKARGLHTELHPATFPPEFVEFTLNTWSNPSDIVYEPFSGSGTTLIACERLGRRCRAVEISPAYVAVAIQRWVDVTGGEPVMISTE